MSQLRPLVFLFMISNICAAEWALKEELIYAPLMLPTDPETITMRRALDEKVAGEAPDINSNIKIVRYATPDEQSRRCLYFAFKRTTEFTGSCPPQLGPIVLNKFWHQTDDPNPGDIAVYLKNSTSAFPKHYAAVKEVIKSKNKTHYILLSKWGSQYAIMEHAPSDAPKSYGNAIVFFTPKYIYKSDIKRLGMLMSKELTNPYEEKTSDDQETDLFLIGFYVLISILKISGLI